MTTPLDWIAVDWGTTRLRAWGCASDGGVLQRATSNRGMGRLAAGGFETALLELVDSWLAPGRITPVYACGMVGARQGWIEAPYREVPCAPLAAGLVRAPVRDPRLGVSIVPGLSQPEPADVMRGEAEIGAGTVLSVAEVAEVAAAGGRFVVSPNCNPAVIAETRRRGLESFPGVLTPSECYAALEAGATALKVFPATMMGVDGLRAIRAVLPEGTRVLMVGGVDEGNFDRWRAAGADGFGIGSALYRPGKTVAAVADDARRLVAALGRESRA